MISAGGGLIGLSICYVLIDVYQLWTGAPFIFLGMNSILAYSFHGIFNEFFPFSYALSSHPTHAQLLQRDFIGATCWLVVAYYWYSVDFFVKV